MTLEVGMRGTGDRKHRLTMLVVGVLCAWLVLAQSASATPPLITSTSASKVSSASALLEADVNAQGAGTTYHFEYGLADCSLNPCTSVPVPDASAGSGSSPLRVKEAIEGLTPSTTYHFRLVASNGELSNGPDRIFVTLGTLFEGLPDGRVYEQASPLDKDGGDAVGAVSVVKAASDGNGISFGSTFGIPGGKGAQAPPTYLAARGAGQAGWSTQGLLPPTETGDRAKVLAWTPDYSEVFSKVTKLGNPRTEALLAQSTETQELSFITPYVPGAEFGFSGTSADASTVLFETEVKLPPKAGDPLIPAALQGASNVYAWDRASGEVHLADVFNDGSAPAKGAFAGPYDWSSGMNATTLREGGGALSYYLQDMHAITPEGSVYFTAAVSGQLYLRLNPTKAQSPLNGEGKCENPALACTIHVSASQRSVPDPAGEQPAAFQAASADGSEVFFTSPEKLTDESNTGPEQPKAAIGRAKLNGEEVEDLEFAFIPKRAVGVTVDGSHVYWADPVAGTIGRADLNGSQGSIEQNFIELPPGECEEEFEVKEGVFDFKVVPVPSTPRYLAVDAGHIYWTNTGRLGVQEQPLDGGGTIGRATLNGEAVEEIDPDFICGEEKTQPKKFLVSNPQGIGVNGSHIYWANAAEDPFNQTIARASIGGGAVEGEFFRSEVSRLPIGLALSSTHVYFDLNEEVNNDGYISRIPLNGGPEELRFVGEAGLRGVAVDGAHVYWTSQSEGAIGRADIELTPESKDNKFIELEGKLNGVAADAEHIYWATNGESPSNAGNDIYRFEPATGTLSDLTVLPVLPGDNGAEVQGVLGASADGSYVYFAANGSFDGAPKGNCKGSVKEAKGKCNLYLAHEGQISFVAPLNVSGSNSDSLNWVGTPLGVASSSGYFPKTSFLSADGQTLLFRSREKLSSYDNEGIPEFYRYQAANGAISCVTCSPGGEAVGGGPSLGSIAFPATGPFNSIAAYVSRNLSASGGRVFFETPEALSPADTNGAAGCPPSGKQGFPACLDVYEWEAPGEGSCKEGGPSYSQLTGGCTFLISTGKDKFPSLFGDASLSGKDVFFFTRQQLVGQDEDELQDVYDARVGGGLAAQNPPPPQPPCLSTEACHGPVQTPPAETSPTTPNFIGPGNQVSKHKKQKPKKHKKQKAKKQKHKKHKANAKGRTQR